MAEQEISLLVGTGKGGFLIRKKPDEWDIKGPFFPGRAVYAMMMDRRAGRNRIWAAATSWHFGAELVWSDDLGDT
jgi:hypothetical protein